MVHCGSPTQGENWTKCPKRPEWRALAPDSPKIFFAKENQRLHCGRVPVSRDDMDSFAPKMRIWGDSKLGT